MKLLFLFLALCFGVGAMVSGIYWSLIRSAYMERHGVPSWKYFFWKPEELFAMLREEKAHARVLYAGLAVVATSTGAILLLAWILGPTRP